VYEKLREWKTVLDKGTKELNDEQLKIKDSFLKADEIIFHCQTSQRYSDAKNTSQFESDETTFSQFGIPQRDQDAIYTSQIILIESKLLDREVPS
ncbi:10982_t:CDS:2, partial [Dentiscutata heterogama]